MANKKPKSGKSKGGSGKPPIKKPSQQADASREAAVPQMTPQDRYAAVKPLWQSLTQEERLELLAVDLDTLRTRAKQMAQAARQQSAAQAAAEGVILAPVIAEAPASPGVMQLCAGVDPSLPEVLEEGVQRLRDGTTWKLWQWHDDAEFLDAEAFRQHVTDKFIREDLVKLLPRDDPKALERPAETAFRLRMTELMQKVQASNRAMLPEEPNGQPWPTPQPQQRGGRRRRDGNGGTGGGGAQDGAVGGTGGHYGRDSNMELLNVLLDVLVQEHDGLLHSLLTPLTSYVMELLPEESRETTKYELFFEDLVKLMPDDVARMVEWLNEKVDALSTRLKAEPKEEEEEEEDNLGDVDLWSMTEDKLQVNAKWLQHLQERLLGEDGHPRKVKAGEDPQQCGLVLEWVYGSIVSTAEKARDGAKRCLGSQPPSAAEAHATLVKSLEDYQMWESRLKQAKDILNDILRCRLEAAELAKLQQGAAAGGTSAGQGAAAAAGASAAAAAATSADAAATAEGSAAVSADRSAAAAGGREAAGGEVVGAAPAAAALPVSATLDESALSDQAIVAMLRREVLLTRAKLHYLVFEHLQQEKLHRTLKAQLRMGEPEFERLKRELEEVKHAPRAGLDGTYRSAAEMERHRHQLADAAIEEQLEVQTAFREHGARLQGIYDRKQKCEFEMSKRETEVKQLQGWKGTVESLLEKFIELLAHKNLPAGSSGGLGTADSNSGNNGKVSPAAAWAAMMDKAEGDGSGGVAASSGDGKEAVGGASSSSLSEAGDVEEGGGNCGVATASAAAPAAAAPQQQQYMMTTLTGLTTHEFIQLGKLRQHFYKDVRKQLYSDADDKAFFDNIKTEVREVTKRLEDARVALQHLETHLLNVACDDPGTAIGTQLALPILQERLDARAREVAAKKAQMAEHEIIQMEIEAAEREAAERERRRQARLKKTEKSRGEKERLAAELQAKQAEAEQNKLLEAQRREAAAEEERLRRLQELEELRRAEEAAMEQRRQELLNDEHGYWRQRMMMEEERRTADAAAQQDEASADSALDDTSPDEVVVTPSANGHAKGHGAYRSKVPGGGAPRAFQQDGRMANGHAKSGGGAYDRRDDTNNKASPRSDNYKGYAAGGRQPLGGPAPTFHRPSAHQPHTPSPTPPPPAAQTATVVADGGATASSEQSPLAGQVSLQPATAAKASPAPAPVQPPSLGAARASVQPLAAPAVSSPSAAVSTAVAGATKVIAPTAAGVSSANVVSPAPPSVQPGDTIYFGSVPTAVPLTQVPTAIATPPAPSGHQAAAPPAASEPAAAAAPPTQQGPSGPAMLTAPEAAALVDLEATSSPAAPHTPPPAMPQQPFVVGPGPGGPYQQVPYHGYPPQPHYSQPLPYHMAGHGVMGVPPVVTGAESGPRMRQLQHPHYQHHPQAGHPGSSGAPAPLPVQQQQYGMQQLPPGAVLNGASPPAVLLRHSSGGQQQLQQQHLRAPAPSGPGMTPAGLVAGPSGMGPGTPGMMPVMMHMAPPRPLAPGMQMPLPVPPPGPHLLQRVLPPPPPAVAPLGGPDAVDGGSPQQQQQQHMGQDCAPPQQQQVPGPTPECQQAPMQVGQAGPPMQQQLMGGSPTHHPGSPMQQHQQYPHMHPHHPHMMMLMPGQYMHPYMTNVPPPHMANGVPMMPGPHSHGPGGTILPNGVAPPPPHMMQYMQYNMHPGGPMVAPQGPGPRQMPPSPRSSGQDGGGMAGAGPSSDARASGSSGGASVLSAGAKPFVPSSSSASSPGPASTSAGYGGSEQYGGGGMGRGGKGQRGQNGGGGQVMMGGGHMMMHNGSGYPNGSKMPEGAMSHQQYMAMMAPANGVPYPMRGGGGQYRNANGHYSGGGAPSQGERPAGGRRQSGKNSNHNGSASGGAAVTWVPDGADGSGGAVLAPRQQADEAKAAGAGGSRCEPQPPSPAGPLDMADISDSSNSDESGDAHSASQPGLAAAAAPPAPATMLVAPPPPPPLQAVEVSSAPQKIADATPPAQDASVAGVAAAAAPSPSAIDGGAASPMRSTSSRESLTKEDGNASATSPRATAAASGPSWSAIAAPQAAGLSTTSTCAPGSAAAAPAARKRDGASASAAPQGASAAAAAATAASAESWRQKLAGSWRERSSSGAAAGTTAAPPAGAASSPVGQVVGSPAASVAPAAATGSTTSLPANGHRQGTPLLLAAAQLSVPPSAPPGTISVDMRDGAVVYQPAGAAATSPAAEASSTAVVATAGHQQQQQRVSLQLVRGLLNEGGSYNCFINVVLQSLWSLRSLRDALLSLPPPPPPSTAATAAAGAKAQVVSTDMAVLHALCSTFRAMASKPALTSASEPATRAADDIKKKSTSGAAVSASSLGACAVSPSRLREALSSLTTSQAAVSIELSEMHDASEILGVVLNCMHRAEHCRPPPAASQRPAAPAVAAPAVASGPDGSSWRSVPPPPPPATDWASTTSQAQPLDVQLPQRVRAGTVASGARDKASTVHRLFGLDMQEPTTGGRAASPEAESLSLMQRSSSRKQLQQQQAQPTSPPMPASVAASGEVVQFTKFFHLVHAQGLRRAAASLGGGAMFEDVLRRADDDTGRDAILLRRPQIFLLSVVWESPQAPLDAIRNTLEALAPQVDLALVFPAPAPASPPASASRLPTAASRLHLLRAIICYFGHHYQAFAWSEELGLWLLFDDASVVVVGQWLEVGRTMVAKRLQPAVLLYECPPQRQ